jgi:hypothetical protein
MITMAFSISTFRSDHFDHIEMARLVMLRAQTLRDRGLQLHYKCGIIKILMM